MPSLYYVKIASLFYVRYIFLNFEEVGL
jgi:hypothetical protein